MRNANRLEPIRVSNQSALEEASWLSGRIPGNLQHARDAAKAWPISQQNKDIAASHAAISTKPESKGRIAGSTLPAIAGKVVSALISGTMPGGCVVDAQMTRQNQKTENTRLASVDSWVTGLCNFQQTPRVSATGAGSRFRKLKRKKRRHCHQGCARHAAGR